MNTQKDPMDLVILVFAFLCPPLAIILLASAFLPNPGGRVSGNVSGAPIMAATGIVLLFLANCMIIALWPLVGTALLLLFMCILIRVVYRRVRDGK